jgi:hypothetical protein
VTLQLETNIQDDPFVFTRRRSRKDSLKKEPGIHRRWEG